VFKKLPRRKEVHEWLHELVVEIRVEDFLDHYDKKGSY